MKGVRRISFSLAVGYAIAVSAGWMNPTTPGDFVLNLPPVEVHEELQRTDERPALVVLQHGICRSAWSLWRLERALRLHGYEVLNPSYPSTRATNEEHAARLEAAIEARLAGRDAELLLVGHSMGGLVLRSYLERPTARDAAACVFIATPHRGAALSAAREHLFAYDLFMGSKAGRQLVPGDPYYDSLGPVRVPRIGCIYGGKGDDDGWNDDVPGDDDLTVGVAEAQLPEQTDAIRLRRVHTELSLHDEVIRQVLVFLRDGVFAR